MPLRFRYAAVTGFILLVCLAYMFWPFKAGLPINSSDAGKEIKLPVKTAMVEANKAVNKPVTQKETVNPRWVSRWEDTSLAGSAVDRASVVMKNGVIQLNGGVLVYFDYFLSLEGEMSMTRIKELVRQDMQANFSADIANQLYDLFERYVAYLAAMADRLRNLTAEQVKAEGITEQSLAKEVRPQYFSETEVDALFGGYERMLTFKSAASSFQEKFETFQHTDEKYAFAMATELFGAEAAGRLQELQKQRDQWQQRLAEYYHEKRVIMDTNGLATEDKVVAINNLLQRNFDIHEQVRVKVLEKQTTLH
jgi:lipase chaperone LimK